VKFTQRRPKNASEKIPDHESYIVDVLLKIAEGPSVGTKSFQHFPPGIEPAKEGEKCRMEVVPCMLTCLREISHVKMMLPKDLTSVDSRNGVKRSLDEIKRRMPDGVAVLDPIENMRIKDDSFKKVLRVSTPGSTKGSF
jgi:ATP-dependent RNA helicase DOB1